MHIHKWTKWVDISWKIVRIRGGVKLEGVGEGQERVCTVCGLKKVREF